MSEMESRSSGSSGDSLTATLLPCSSYSSGAPSANASSASTTAGSSSISTKTAAAASAPCWRDSANTTATCSPTNRTRSRARGARAKSSWILTNPWCGAMSRSSAVQTATTPGIAAASDVSIERMTPWATSERTNTACSRSSNGRSAVYLATPVSKRGSSVRSTRVPSRDPPAPGRVAESVEGDMHRNLSRTRARAPSLELMTAVLETFPLGFQWQTADPFLFCVHHLDRYPAGNPSLGPAASLAGRRLGQDFDGIDGWRMYHGQVVPGFPAHPHRGFETVTYVRRGLIDHSDSLGAAARFGRGDVQWLTAGAGVVHSEMFPLLERDEPNTLELFQIWLNLPQAHKMVEPHFSMLWDDDIPRLRVESVDGAVAEITVIAGRLGDLQPPSPPPSSWPSRADSDLAIWHIVLDPGATWTLPLADSDDATRVLYVFEGGDLLVDGESIAPSTGVRVDSTRAVPVIASEHTEILMLQGRPLNEPVAQYGPFVMNSRAEIEEAFADYQRTRFGGWPWDRDDPVHGLDRERFARHADGRVEQVAPV